MNSIPDIKISNPYINPANAFSNISNLNIGQIIQNGVNGVNLITLVFFFIGLFFFANIIIAGWEYMLSSGDPKKFAAANSRFLNGFMGLGIAIFSFIIVNLVTTMIGLGSLL